MTGLLLTVNLILKLENRKYELVFRAVNLAGVSGPEHKIIIDSK